MQVKRIFIMIITFIMAICLSIIALPDWANWLRPEWVVLVLCFWILKYPQKYNLGLAWTVGLLLDALYGTVLGEHALAMTIVAFLIYRFQRIINHYPVWFQGIFIMLCGFAYNMILFLLQWALGHGVHDWRFWITPLLSCVLWPFVSEALLLFQKKLKVS